MRRRTFCSLLSGAVASPFAVRAQPTGKPRVGVGVGGGGPLSDRSRDTVIAALRDLGWIDGQNVTIDVRWREEEIEDLVRLKVDVLFLAGPIRLQIGSRLTQTIPIVGQDLESDPIARGFAQSLARPGINITGIFLDIPEIAGKQLQYLQDMVPDLRRLAVLWDDRIGDVPFRAMETAARSEGISVQSAVVLDSSQIDSAIGRLVEGRPQALLALTSPYVFATQGRIAELALLHGLPSISGFTTFPAAGGLMAYGPDFYGTLRQAAGYVDRILKGAKPGDLPIERPTKFQLTVNLKTAKVLGLTVPPSVLLRADEVIE
jgi:putative ABC transport system substrate-binding protein